MAMTKKFKVSFDVTAVIDSKSEQNLMEQIKSIAKKVAAGEEVNPFKQEMLVQALTYGPEGLTSFLTKSALRAMIKDVHNDLCAAEQKLMRFSPATVREVF